MVYPQKNARSRLLEAVAASSNAISPNISPRLSVVKPEAGKQRDYALDNLKGVLIILVILGHGDLLTNFKSPIGDFTLGYIYLFHMPLFFAVSCLFIKEFSWVYFWKRFVQLMVPFFFFVIIDPRTIVMHLLHPHNSELPMLFHFSFKAFIEKALIGSSFYLQSALWFLPALFVANILLSVLLKYRDKKILIIVAALAFAAVLFFANSIQQKRYEHNIPYGLEIAAYLLPFLALCRYIYNKRERFMAYNPGWYFLGIIISSFLVFYLVPKSDPGANSGRFDLAQFDVPNTIWAYAFLVALWLSILLFALSFNRKSIFSYIGLYTLPIFLLHTSIWFGDLQHLPAAWYLPVNVIGNVVLGILISKLLMKISPRFRWIGMVA